MSNNNTYGVIMAGGIGSRFWPMSKSSFPKQFLDILGTGETLIQMTYNRFLKSCDKENVFVVTNEEYKSLVLEQLDGINESQILCEPSRRNTAPCVAYAAYKINALNPMANIVVAPSDHLILKTEDYIQTIETAIEKAASGDFLVTLGIKPSRPDTGYGYIQFVDDDSQSSVKKVKTFTEKPNHDLAVTFLESGDFFWNSGIFIFSAKSIIKAFHDHLSEVATLFNDDKKYNTDAEKEFIEDIYAVCKNISIDYGILEKAENVHVVLSDFGWSDLGTWGSLYTHLSHDENNNASIGDEVRFYDSKNCIVNIPKKKLAVLHGLEDYIVVDTEEALLIVKKHDEQKIKQFVTDLKADQKDQFV